MFVSKIRRSLIGAAAALSLVAVGGSALAADTIKLRLSSPASANDERAIALTEIFAPAVSSFAEFDPHWNASLFKQGTELEAISRGNLDMSIASAQELAEFFPEFGVFAAGYVHRDAAHQVAVFNSDFFKSYKKTVEDKLGVKLLTIMYLGRRQLNLRTDNVIKTPADMAGIKLRMPGSESWQFLGKALGANPVPMAFGEVYTALQTGAVDGQDNPLPTVQKSKFYEVTKQIVLTNHLVDLNYVTISQKVWNKLTADQQATVQKAADAAAESGRQKQLKLEGELEAFMKSKGLKVYSPDLNAFRSAVQAAYLKSDLSKSWEKGALEKINAL